MRKEILIIALGLSLIAGRSGAEALAMPEGSPSAMTKSSLPGKGTSMADVAKKFGEPATKRPTVGGDSPKHPPITRWDYAGFSVIFEKNKVIDAVIPGAPPAVYHQEQLTPAGDSAPPMPGAVAPAQPAPASMEAPADAAPVAPAAATQTPAEAAPPTSEPQAAAPVATPENPNPDRPPPPK